MFKSFILFLVFSGVFISCTETVIVAPPTKEQQEGGDTAGNGGDAIIAVFRDARDMALLNLEKIDRCNLEKVTQKSEVIDFLITNKIKFIEDVKKSKHKWSTDNSPDGKCGRTKPGHPITLYIPNCKIEMEDTHRAAWLLVHESVHHFKIEDEEFADAAMKKMNGRYYAGRPLLCEFSPVTDFKEARCRQYDEGTCDRGPYCNFMHVRQPCRELQEHLEKVRC